MKLIFLFFGGIAALLISLRYFPAPYIWISLSFFVVFLYGAISRIKPAVRLVCVNIAIIFLVIGSLEAYLWTSQGFRDKERFEGDIFKKGYNVRNDILGYAPGKGKAFTSIKFLGQKKLYSVTYTIGTNGLRVVPQYNKKENKCVIFFGDSFTFGEGLNDDETLPYRVSIKTEGQYKIYNFGFQGYGPHQMLSAIEHNMIDNIIECKPKHVIYPALAAHVDRSAGPSPWDQHGPRYILLEDGSVKYSGHFDDDKIDGGIRPKIRNEMNKSLLYDKYFNRKEPVSRANIDLFVGIIDKSKRLLEEHYPGLKFHMILWDNPEKNRELIIDLLNEKDIPIHLIEKILPDYSENKSKYAIVPHYDYHPNARANELIADYIITNFLKE